VNSFKRVAYLFNIRLGQDVLDDEIAVFVKLAFLFGRDSIAPNAQFVECLLGIHVLSPIVFPALLKGAAAKGKRRLKLSADQAFFAAIGLVCREDIWIPPASWRSSMTETGMLELRIGPGDGRR
jgi:hypothetical protein